MLTPMLKALVGAEFSFKMNGRGELSDIKVPQKVVGIAPPGRPGGNRRRHVLGGGLKNLISQSSLTLAEERAR